MNDEERTRVCLECWRDFTQDIFHFDCTREHIVSKAEADELREWLTGRHEFIVRTGQALLHHDGKNVQG